MLLHLPGARAAAHAEIFERTAEASLLVPLEVRQRDDNIRVHNRLSYLRFLYKRQIDGNECFIAPLESVRDDHMAAGLQG